MTLPNSWSTRQLQLPEFLQNLIKTVPYCCYRWLISVQAYIVSATLNLKFNIFLCPFICVLSMHHCFGSWSNKQFIGLISNLVNKFWIVFCQTDKLSSIVNHHCFKTCAVHQLSSYWLFCQVAVGSNSGTHLLHVSLGLLKKSSYYKLIKLFLPSNYRCNITSMWSCWK